MCLRGGKKKDDQNKPDGMGCNTHKRDEKYMHTLKLQDMTLKTYTHRGQLVWQRVE